MRQVVLTGPPMHTHLAAAPPDGESNLEEIAEWCEQATRRAVAGAGHNTRAAMKAMLVQVMSCPTCARGAIAAVLGLAQVNINVKRDM